MVTSTNVLGFPKIEPKRDLVRSLITKYQMVRHPGKRSALIFLRSVGNAQTAVLGKQPINRINYYTVIFRYADQNRYVQQQGLVRHGVKEQYIWRVEKTGNPIGSKPSAGFALGVRPVTGLDVMRVENVEAAILSRSINWLPSQPRVSLITDYRGQGKRQGLTYFGARELQVRKTEKLEVFLREVILAKIVLNSYPGLRRETLTEWVVNEAKLSGVDNTPERLRKTNLFLRKQGLGNQCAVRLGYHRPELLYRHRIQSEDTTLPGKDTKPKFENVSVDGGETILSRSSVIPASRLEIPEPVNIDQIAERVWRMLEKRKAIERDRRGWR
jgi:hypothetical protein